MKMSNSTEVIQTLNSKLLFGVEVPEKVLNTLISNDTFPCLHYIYNINRLIMKPHLDKKDILNHKKIFYDNRDSFSLLTGLPEFQINEKELFNEENCLLSRFSCVNLIERIFKYGQPDQKRISFNFIWR